MYYNIIGPCGCGKTTFIKDKFDLDYSGHIKVSGEEFVEQKRNKVFEHTGHNELVNSFLASLEDDEVVTIVIHRNVFICIYRIIKEFRKKTLDRIECCLHCFKNEDKVMLKGLVIKI